MIDALLQRFRQHDRLALSRLLSFLARGQHTEEILRQLEPKSRAARIVAVTGSGGVGKSTLVGKLIEQFRQRSLSVAVLACDPESPLSGGALLGDRFRMPSRPDDDGVFIRSLAAASGHGAIAEHLPAMLGLLEAFGFDLVLLETAGAGQGDTQARRLADVLVLLVQPETGDDVQWEKAGLMEVADMVVVHKADLPGAEQATAQLRSAVDLAGHQPIPVLPVSSRTGAGLGELVQAILDSPPRRTLRSSLSKDLLLLAQEVLAARCAAALSRRDPGVQHIIDAWQRRELAPVAAGAALLRLLAQEPSQHHDSA
jgi:LAO/AO transport system ATPase